MAITAMNQTEAHRRRLLIAGAAGLGDTGAIMEGHAAAPAADDITDATSSGGTYTGAEAGSPSASTELPLD
jgi:hypothetical protein